MILTWFAWLLPMGWIRRYVLMNERGEYKCQVTFPGEHIAKPYYLYPLGRGTYMITSHESVLQTEIRDLKRKLSYKEDQLDRIVDPKSYEEDDDEYD